MTLGGLAGLMTAGQMAHAYDRHPHVSAVYALMQPGADTSVHWIGDCRAYGWDGEGERLVLWSTDQTMGEWLRWNGTPVEIAEEHDNWALLGLAQATATTCRQVQIPHEVGLVLIVSDGISDQVDQRTAEDLCSRFLDAPQELADALVAAAEADADGYRDDATVVVLRMRT